MANAHDITATPIARAAVVSRRPRLSAFVCHDVTGAGRLWQQLEANPAATFHQSRAWVEAWVGGTGTTLSIVTLELEGQPLAILPLEIVHRRGLKVARFAGTAFSNANTGLLPESLTGARADIAPGELAAALSRAGLDADIVLFDKMPPDAASQSPFSELPRVFHQNPSFQLPLLTDFNAVLAQINGKRRRKKFRVSQRRLEALGGYRHIIGEDDEQALRLLEVFLKQKPVRLAAQGLPNVFADPGVRAFMARLAMTRDQRGRPALELHGIELTGGDNKGEIIAVAGLTIKDRHVTCQFGSINDEIAPDASVGELLFYHMIERASVAGEQVFDFGVGDQLYKRSWCPVRTDLVDCHVPLTVKGRLAAPAITGMIRLKRKIKTSPMLHRFAAWLRGLVVRRQSAPVDI
ncbi:GNAT family N-acetyltransferase [Hoeflea sp. G2-23]|uniref:GNAT family N-acetyltransferase n=1 Tax=Hoeflea algicola TaxID=2983763 RepID=A0ABT3Z532_9HYPH|nr:GNAT family N-acetyltransferase [Hoeflea algicola]MCY0146494.1 GNAT family N-acetyltransferase [Hoeflea algicola]